MVGILYSIPSQLLEVVVVMDWRMVEVMVVQVVVDRARPVVQEAPELVGREIMVVPVQ